MNAGSTVDETTAAPVDEQDPDGVGDHAPTEDPADHLHEEHERTGVSTELLDRLRPYLAESLMVLDADWTVTANLAPPGGLIGRGLGLGVHTLEDMHPDDAIQVMELGIQAFSTRPGWQGSKLVRMRRGDGTYGRYEITAINCFDDPIVAGMVVRTREVPSDVQDDLPDLHAGSVIETVAELLPIGLLLLDPRGQVVFANDAACAMLDREPEAVKRDGLLSMIAEPDQVHVGEAIARLVASPGREECTIALAQARVERVQCRFSAEAGEEVAYIVVTMEDVTERDAAQRELEKRANHDHLTGLRNRGSISDVLRGRLERGEPTAVAYLDLDGFKAVNDTWGHDRGDHLLIAIADALRNAMDESAEIARMGGDEFVIVTANGDGDGDRAISTLLDRLQDVVATVARTEGLAVTASIGVDRSQPGDSPRDLVRRADQAMYTAKARRPPTAS